MAHDKNTNKALYDESQKKFVRDLIKDLTSLGSSYAGICSYVEPYVETGFCEEMYPHKIID